MTRATIVPPSPSEGPEPRGPNGGGCPGRRGGQSGRGQPLCPARWMGDGRSFTSNKRHRAEKRPHGGRGGALLYKPSSTRTMTPLIREVAHFKEANAPQILFIQSRVHSRVHMYASRVYTRGCTCTPVARTLEGAHVRPLHTSPCELPRNRFKTDSPLLGPRCLT